MVMCLGCILIVLLIVFGGVVEVGWGMILIEIVLMDCVL